MKPTYYILTFVFALLTICAKASTGKFYTGNVMSSGFVTCMVQDKGGFIWMGTNFGLNRFDGYRFTSYTYKEGDLQSINNNGITTLYVDRSGRLWVGSVNGLSLYDASADNFEHIILSKDVALQPHIASITEDKHGNVYVGTSGFGLYKIKSQETKAIRVSKYTYHDNDDYYPCVFIDGKNRLWKADNNNMITCFRMDTHQAVLNYRSDVGPVMRILGDGHGRIVAVCQYGILRFDGKTITKIDDGQSHRVYNGAFRSVFDVIVIATNSNGAFSLDPQGKLEPVSMMNDNVDLATANITGMLEDRARNLWIGCAEKGLAFVPGEKPQFQSLTLQQFGIRTSSVVTSVCHGGDDKVLLTISGKGLYCKNIHSNGLAHLSSPNNSNMIYRDSRGKYWLSGGTDLYAYDVNSEHAMLKGSFNCIDIRAMADDGENLYFSAFGQGLCVMNIGTGAKQIYSMFDKPNRSTGVLCNNWILKLLRDRHGMIWIGTASGVQCYDPRRKSFKPFGWDNILNGKPAIGLAEDPKGNIVIGTNNGLYLYNRATRKATIFPHSENLQGVQIDYIVSLQNGDLWCSSSMGIWHYDSRHQQFMSYTNGNGLTLREYMGGVGMMTNNGNIVFGTPEGITMFNPQLVSRSVYSVKRPMLTCIVVGGKPINGTTQSDGRNIIDGPVLDAQRINLSYLDNTFALEFSTFDFANVDNMQLEYRLDNDKWTQNQEGVNSINFTHLNPGYYKLAVRTNNHGHVSAVSTYLIIVRPPWYRSTFAYVLYIMVILIATGGGIYMYYRRKQEELYEDKMQFLINATHDIRTPLTLILNPLHQLMQLEESKMPQLQDKLQTINHNAVRILTLVNQILDIRKMDKMQMHLKCSETSLVQLVNDVFHVFEYEAQKRNISFHCDYDGDIKVYVDKKEFDKVITNLLSNAFKFTADGGEIAVKLSADGRNAVIEVIDNGIGLKDDDMERIFNRFYQGGSKAVTGTEGTGIGLNLCRIIVDMHHGKISARNRTDVKGSVFSVSIPLGKGHLKPEEIVEEVKDETTEPVKRPVTNYKILLVDDDEEITDYISKELAQNYRFTVCRNGKQAIGELLTNKYDLVVSDVMMPEMDGFTMLRMIKTNSNISYIPVILLTTEAAIGNRLEGLERGADAFLAKPFLLDELRATIDNLIINRLKLKGKFSGAQEQTDKVEQQEVVDNDKELMDRIMKSINKNIGDSDFNVEMLCQEISVSRTQLHRKMKELTGLSTAEFIRNIRLEQAARLLKERHANISQVAYTLGFVNTAHFSKVFKQHFGVPPSEYGKREDVSE